MAKGECAYDARQLMWMQFGALIDVQDRRILSMATAPRIPVPLDRLAEFCARSCIRRLALFGSVLRDDFGPSSDIDVLVEFEPGTRIGLIGFQGLEDELTAIFGRRVDLNTRGSLSKYFVDEVLAEARTVHVAA